MTLAQLQSFVLVARHGSVKAAAAELEVTEPAVSVAVSALKKELGDDLFVRSGRGIALTPGGRRLAALATEILGLAEQARRSVAENSGAPRRLSVLATPLVAEHIGPLIELFTARDEDVEIAVSTAPAAAFAEALEHRRADIALGPSPSGYHRAADRAGPEQVTLAEAVALIRRKDGKPPPRLITLTPRGGTLRAYAVGANLPDADAKIGGSSFREFLSA